jgi:hypothetical protein
MNNKNAEGYPDPTATEAIANVERWWARAVKPHEQTEESESKEVNYGA